MQGPDDRHGKSPDREVDEQIGNPVPTIELVLVDAAARLDRLIP